MIALQKVLLGFDKAVYFFFQGLQRPWLDTFLAWPTYLGEMPVALGLTALLILVMDRRKCFHALAVASVSILSSYGVAHLFKDLIGRPRPFILWDQAHVIFHKSFTCSFPSGHATVIFSAAFILNALYPGKMRWAYGVAVWVGLTRIYVGAHYPTDVLAGAALGIVWAAVCLELYKRILPKSKN